jgi:hypothetical protein
MNTATSQYTLVCTPEESLDTMPPMSFHPCLLPMACDDQKCMIHHITRKPAHCNQWQWQSLAVVVAIATHNLPRWQAAVDFLSADIILQVL